MADDHLDKYKELYILSKETFKAELDRFYSIEHKASQYLSALTLLLGVAGFFVKWIVEHFIPPQSCLVWLLFCLALAILLCLVAAWFFVFSVLRVQKLRVIPLDAKMIGFFDKNKPIDIYYHLSVKMAEELEKNWEVTGRKSKRLNRGYLLMCISVLLLVIFSVLFGIYKWHEPKTSGLGELPWQRTTINQQTQNRHLPTHQQMEVGLEARRRRPASRFPISTRKSTVKSQPERDGQTST